MRSPEIEVVEIPSSDTYISKRKKRNREVTDGATISPDVGLRRKRGKEKGINGSLTRKLAELEHERIWKSVQNLGASQFTGRKKQEHETARICAIGGTPNKPQTYPFKMMVRMRAKHKLREEKRKKEEREASIVTGRSTTTTKTGSKKKNLRGGRNRGRGGKDKHEEIHGPAPGSSVRGGVLRVHKS